MQHFDSDNSFNSVHPYELWKQNPYKTLNKLTFSAINPPTFSIYINTNNFLDMIFYVNVTNLSNNLEVFFSFFFSLFFSFTFCPKPIFLFIEKNYLFVYFVIGLLLLCDILLIYIWSELCSLTARVKGDKAKQLEFV